MVLVFKEPDFGSTLIYGSALLAVLFFGGVPWKHLASLAIVTALIALSVLWFLPAAGVEVLDAYQKDRLIGFVNPDVDPSGTTYNVNQSITAVGSGGIDGRGVAGASQTNMNYLPEHNTDFIFSSLAEQRGFLGAAILLLLYAFIAWRGIKIVAIAPSLYTSAVAGAIVFSFLFQIFVNVGMTIGIAPVTGIPLPFVSFGGSSMITTMLDDRDPRVDLRARSPRGPQVGSLRATTPASSCRRLRRGQGDQGRGGGPLAARRGGRRRARGVSSSPPSAEGGDTSALRDLSGREVSKYDLQGAALLLYVVAGERPTAEDEQALKLADRNDVDAVCVLVGAKSTAGRHRLRAGDESRDRPAGAARCPSSASPSSSPPSRRRRATRWPRACLSFARPSWTRSCAASRARTGFSALRSSFLAPTSRC